MLDLRSDVAFQRGEGGAGGGPDRGQLAHDSGVVVNRASAIDRRALKGGGTGGQRVTDDVGGPSRFVRRLARRQEIDVTTDIDGPEVYLSSPPQILSTFVEHRPLRRRAVL